MFEPVRQDAQSSTSIVHRGALGMVGVLFQGMSRFLTSLIIGRIGGPVVLGTVASAISAAQLLALVWPSSTGSAASKFVARARGQEDFEEASAVAAHLGRRTLQATFLLACVAIPLWMTLDRGSLIGGLCVAMLVIGYSGSNFTRGLAFGSAQIPRVTQWDLFTSSLGIAGVLVSLSAGARGLVLLMPLAATSLLFTAACWPWRAHGRLRPALRHEIDVFVALATAGALTSAGFLQISMLAARLAGGREGAGQYAAALALATPLSIIAGSLSLVLYPSMSEAYGRGDHVGFRRQTDQATRFLAIVMVAVVGSLVLCSRLVISLIWGTNFAEAGTLFPVLLLAILATTLGVPSVNSLTSKGQDGMLITTLASALGLVVGVATWVLLATHLGVLGVALGYLTGSATTSCIAFVSAWRRERQQWLGLVARIGVALAVVVGLFAIQHTLTLNLWLDPVIAAAFSISWLLVSRTDALQSLTLVTERLKRAS
jgi:O-antigen/teichoic acid export membrane protein